MSCTVAWSCIVVCFWYHLSASNDYHVSGIEAYFSTQWHSVEIRLVLRLFVHSTKDLFVTDAAFGSSQGADPVQELQAIEAHVLEKHQERKLEKANPMQLMFGKRCGFWLASNCRYTAAREVIGISDSLVQCFTVVLCSLVPHQTCRLFWFPIATSQSCAHCLMFLADPPSIRRSKSDTSMVVMEGETSATKIECDGLIPCWLMCQGLCTFVQHYHTERSKEAGNCMSSQLYPVVKAVVVRTRRRSCLLPSPQFYGSKLTVIVFFLFLFLFSSLTVFSVLVLSQQECADMHRRNCLICLCEGQAQCSMLGRREVCWRRACQRTGYGRVKGLVWWCFRKVLNLPKSWLLKASTYRVSSLSDVETYTRGKYALALSHWGRPSEGMLGSIKSMRAAADKLGQTDLIMVGEHSWSEELVVFEPSLSV